MVRIDCSKRVTHAMFYNCVSSIQCTKRVYMTVVKEMMMMIKMAATIKMIMMSKITVQEV